MHSTYFDLCFKRFDKRRTTHGLCLDNMVIE